MRYARSLSLLALALSASACGWRRTPVPIVSESGSAALLVGKWSGDYSSKETGRNGSITFDLVSEKDTAYCDVVMTPRPTFGQVIMDGRQGVPTTVGLTPTEPLTVRFIRLGDQKVTGTLAPYIDPECGCRVSTIFEGKFTDANTIEGTFVTRGADMTRRQSGGIWKVKRQPVTQTSP